MFLAITQIMETKIQNILAAIDLSETSRAAFEHALALSAQHGAKLHVVQAVPASEPFRWHGGERSALIGKLRHDAERAGVPFRARVQQGDPAKVILLHAKSLQPDLIVVGTHQRVGLERLRSGSVAERVALEATQPVLVVPAGARSDTALRFNRVAVGVDFSTASSNAVRHALAMASGADARVTLVHVVPGFSSGAVPRYLYRFGAVEYQNELARDAWRELQDVMPITAQPGAGTHARVVIGDPSDGISRVADEMNADAIVVGVPRRSKLTRALRGTTAARLLRTVDVPLLTVPEQASRSQLVADRELAHVA